MPTGFYPHKSTPGFPEGVLLDPEDRERLGAYRWILNRANGVVFRSERTPRVNGKRKQWSILLHREIMQAEKGLVVDHINGNPLDNRKANLRVVTHTINSQNKRGAHRGSKSGERGVYWDHRRKYWFVQMKVDGHRVSLGVYKKKEDAVSIAEEARERWMPGYIKHEKGNLLHKYIPPRKKTLPQKALDALPNMKLDKQDKHFLEEHSWTITHHGYVCVRFNRGNNRPLHRLIMKAPKGKYVDHINGDRLDNRRKNLRIVSPAENQQNRRLGAMKNSTSGVRGVYWSSVKSKWLAKAVVRGKYKQIGSFSSLKEAAQASREWRMKHCPGYVVHKGVPV